MAINEACQVWIEQRSQVTNGRTEKMITRHGTIGKVGGFAKCAE